MPGHTRFLIPVIALAVMAGCSGSSGMMPVSDSAHPLANGAVNAPFSYAVHPKIKRLSDLLLHNCPGGTLCALTPTTLRTAYDFNYQSGVQDGTGQTIVILDAYGSPTITTDLKSFDQKTGLPDPPSFQVLNPGGTSVNLNNAVQLGWAEETTLDVEWAHASAPGANIVLVVANNDQGTTIQAAQQNAVTVATSYNNGPPGIVSLSFGVQESSINGGANNTQVVQAHAVYAQAEQSHVTVIASAGDLGSTGGFTFANPQYPASDPLVLSVGGTNLTLFNNGKYRNEAAWNDGIGCATPCGATGGAPSMLWPAFQNETAVTNDPNNMRDVADVSFAAEDNAVAVWIGFSAPGVTPGWYAMGGTSLGAPAYAGIIAIANQMRAAAGEGSLGYINERLYYVYAAQQATKLPPFHDVTSGTNKFVSNIACCLAKTGYDMPTGLGSPDINNLLGTLTAATF